MISVLIPSKDSVAELQVLLTALVPAVVEGLVGQVFVADRDSTDGTAALCQDAGADLIEGGLVAACDRARGDWVLVLPTTFRPTPGWLDRLRRHLSSGRGAGRLEGSRSPGFAGWLLGRPMGLLVPRDRLQSCPECEDFGGILRALGRLPVIAT